MADIGFKPAQPSRPNMLAQALRDITGVIQENVPEYRNRLAKALTSFSDFQQSNTNTGRRLADALTGSIGLPKSTDQDMQQYENDLSTALNFAPLGMIAYHGSPHKFDKFSLDKIGTGEGAQAYGHGLYLAESPEVAKSYSANREYVGKVMNGQPHNVDFESPKWIAQNAADEKGGIDQAISHLDMVLRRRQGLKAPGQAESNAQVKSAIELLKSGQVNPKGQFYKTDIPDEAVARFLDWDKPLSQQAPEVQAALWKYRDADKSKIIDLIRSGEQPNGFGVVKSGKGYAPVVNGEVVGNGPKDLVFGSHDEALSYIAKQIPETDPTAAAIYRRMVGEHGGADGISQAQVSNLLHQQGIPGIRYLDGGSRGAGDGTSNFVSFDPEMIRILERNGQPTGNQPWKPGEWKK